MAPEMIAGHPYVGTSVDIYACGVILFSMVTGLTPVCVQADQKDFLYRYVIAKQWEKFWKITGEYCDLSNVSVSC